PAATKHRFETDTVRNLAAAAILHCPQHFLAQGGSRDFVRIRIVDPRIFERHLECRRAMIALIVKTALDNSNPCCSSDFDRTIQAPSPMSIGAAMSGRCSRSISCDAVQRKEY